MVAWMAASRIRIVSQIKNTMDKQKTDTQLILAEHRSLGHLCYLNKLPINLFSGTAFLRMERNMAQISKNIYGLGLCKDAILITVCHN